MLGIWEMDLMLIISNNWTSFQKIGEKSYQANSFQILNLQSIKLNLQIVSQASFPRSNAIVRKADLGSQFYPSSPSYLSSFSSIYKLINKEALF